MKETLTEAITRKLLEKSNVNTVAREFVDEKMKSLIPYLEDGFCIELRNFYMDIPEFEICNIDGVEIFIKDARKVVIIFRKDIENAFNIQSSSSSNSLKLKAAIDAIHIAFDRLPLRCPYFEHGKGGCIKFKTFI